MNSGRVISVIVVIMMASSSLAMTISSQDAYVPEDNTYTLRLAMQDDIKTLNPLVADDIWTWHVIQWIYDKPVYQDPETKELMPYIAYKSGNSSVLFGFDPQDNWENSSKPEATIYYDFENVRFHDGHQMDIRDILFSYHAAAQHPVWRGDIECLTDNGSFVNGNYSEDNWLDINKTWESQDGMQSTLKFTLQRPYYNFWNITLAPRILPYHIWGNEIASQNVNEAKIWLDPGYTPGSQDSWSFSKARTWDNRDSIGSGPFKFDSWNPGVKSKILTNRDHFYKPGFKHDPDNAKQPIIEAIVFKIYHDWHGVSALKQNDIDMILSPIPPTFVQEIMNEPDLGIKQSAQKGFSYLGYNMRPERRSFGYNEAGEDVEKSLRHAIAHCIDKMTIHSRLLRNFAIVVDGPISCISTWYNDSIPRYAFDPEHAKIILADAGYKLEDGSTGQEAIDNAGSGNWWLNPDGSSIGNAEGGKIEILTPPADYDPVQAQSGLMIAKQMQDIGLYAESIAMDYGTIQNHIDQRDFDMYILDWRIEEDPTEFLYDFFHSNNLDGHNHPGYSNASFDALMDKVRESGNKDERMELIMDAQAAISYDLPYDVLYYRTNIEAYRTDRFTGWVTGPAGSIYHWRSILEMHPPNTKWLSARFVNTPSAIRSSSSVDISVKITSTIKYPDGTFQNELVPGAFVKLAVTNGTLSEYNGTTDAAGIFRTTYTAPYVPPTSEFLRNGSGILLEVCSAELDEYDPAPNKLVLITAYPDEIKFTAISMEADPDVILDNDTAGNPGLANIIITVTDQDKNPVKGADVVIQVDPKEPIVSPEIATTDESGKAIFSFESRDLEGDKEYTISTIAFKTGYKNGTQSCQLMVMDHIHPPQDECDSLLPILQSSIVLVVVTIMILLSALKYTKNRNKKGKQP